MPKQSKKIFVLSIFAVILLSSVYTSLLPTADAAEPNLQTKTLSVLSDVVGIKTEQYTTTQSTQRDSKYLDQPQKETDMHLASPESSFRVTCFYIKDTLQLLYFSDLQGQPSLKQRAANTADMAKGLLERYQNYASDSVYGECASMLSSVDASINVTKSENGMKFEVSNYDQKIVNYKWTYTDSNGVIAERKNVVLNYEDGQLKFFLNNWPLYSVKGTPKISSEDATAIAIEASKNFSYQVTTENDSVQTVSGFNIAPESLGNAVLVYQNFDTESSAREGDPFTLYPTWFVPLGFDRFYPGDISSMIVYLWADTGEVCHMQEVAVDSSGLTPSDDEISPDISLANQQTIDVEINQGSTIMPAQIMIAVLLCVIGISASYRKRILNSMGSRKLLNSRFWAVLLCTSLIFSVLFLAVPSVSAITPDTKSEIYACIHSLNGYKNETIDGPEREASKTVCSYIEGATTDAGYSTSNWCWDPGYGTTVNRVGQNAHNDELNYDRTAVFYVGHKAWDNTEIQDDYGHAIKWQNIDGNITSRSHFFVFLWVCSMAENPSSGMPMAWMHRTDMSSDGFTSPDYQGQCYISFHGFSPMISSYPESQGHPTFYGSGYLGPCQEFIIFFYYYALSHDYSVHDALNQASIWYFSDSYANTNLSKGYSCWWPGGGDPSVYLDEAGYFPEYWTTNHHNLYNETNTSLNRMRVFGDSNIKLYQPQINLTARDNNNNNLDANTVFTLDGEAQYPGNVRLTPKSYVVNVNDIPNYAFSYFSYNGQNYGRGASIPLTTDGQLVAHYNWSPVYYNIAISSSGPGYTTPTGNQQYLSNTYAQVQAYPNSGYIHYWTSDLGGDPDYNPTRYVLMNGAHWVQANFVAAPSYNFVSHVESSSGSVSNPTKINGPDNDGQFATLEGWGPYQIYGAIATHLYFTTTGHIYVYGYASYCAGPLYVYTSVDGSNWNLISTPYVSQGSPGWIDCGYSLSSFSYVAFTAEDSNYIYSISLDSVRVDSTYYTLAISSSGDGYTTPSGNPQYLTNTYAQVYAQANSGAVFDHWLLDGNPAGNNPSINVYMNGPHTLQAVFVPAPSTYVSSITGYGGSVYDPANLVGSQNDGQYTTLEGWGPYEYYGWVSGAMGAQSSGHIYVYGFASYSAGPLYVYTSVDGSNWNLISTPYVSQGSPGWIDCGTCTSPFSYVAFTAEAYNYIYSISIDSVHVEP